MLILPYQYSTASEFLWFIPLFQLPSTQEEWKDVSEKFALKWNFPHALRTMGSKHVRIVKAEQSSSDYYNYKKIFSVVMFTIVDANYEIIICSRWY